MFSSSFDYLEALHAEKFLLFLEWPTFILEKYSSAGEHQSADFLMDCLIFEWLKQGSCERDAEKISLLYKIYEMKPSPLEGQLAFSFISINSALFACMVLQRNNLYGFTLPSEEMTGRQIVRFMSDITAKNIHDMNRESALISEQFIKHSQELDPIIVTAIYKKLCALKLPISISEQYIDALRLDHLKDNNELFAVRLALVQSLLVYLKEQTVLTDEVRVEIIKYVEAISKQQPKLWENEYLRKLSSPSFMTRTLSFFNGVTARFFTFVFARKILESNIKEKELDTESVEKGLTRSFL